MSWEVFPDLEQGTPEWHQVRLGIPTASEFQKVLATTGRDKKTRDDYMRRLAGERLTGRPMARIYSRNFQRGHEGEIKARDLYMFLRDEPVYQVGFIREDRWGCSPDSLVGEEGLLEIKDAEPHIQIERLLEGAMPIEHTAQVQGQIMVSRRKWCDFMSYCEGLPELIVRVERDDAYIARLKIELQDFCDELELLTETIRRMI